MTGTLHDHFADDGTEARVEHARSTDAASAGTRMVLHASIAALLDAQDAARGDAPWLTFHPEAGAPISWTYAEFAALVRRTAHLLWRSGVRRGDRVCTISTNHAETVLQYFGAWYLGAVVVPVNVGEDDRRISYIIEHSRAVLAFVRSQHIERIRHLRNGLPRLQHVIEAGDDVSGTFPVFSRELDACDPGFVPAERPEFDDAAMIVYTSGTTGAPKGVVLDQGNLLVDADAIAAWHRMEPGQRMMCVLPIHHVNGTVVTLVTPMAYGGSVVLLQKFHTERFFDLIERERVHVVSVVPTLLQYLLHEEGDCPVRDLAHFRHIICGAGPLTCELAARFEDAFGIPIIHGYGLSETTCYSCFLPVDLTPAVHRSWLREYGFPSIGVPIPCNEMDIHTPEGVPVPDGTRGEIVIRGRNVMRHYYMNPQANSDAFLHGWFRSGDEGFRVTDEQGRRFFFITGRIKELIIRGGVNIAPLEIDEVIGACPGVKAGIAVGFDNDWYGEEIGALVSKADPALTAERVLEHCRALLPSSKCPKVVVFTDSIPVTSTGKYQRNNAKHLFVEWKAVQFR